MSEQRVYLSLLKGAFAQKRQQNKRYSLRAFADFLEMDPGSLSRVMRGQRVLPMQKARSVAGKLFQSSTETEAFTRSVLDEHRQRMFPAEPTNAAGRDLEQIDNQSFEPVSDFMCIAILEATNLDKGVFSAKDIAHKLGITEIEVRQGLAVLKSNGLIKILADGQIVKTRKHFTTKNKTETSKRLKSYQKEILLRAVRSLEMDPIGKRSITSMTMAIQPSKLELARTLIQDFMQNLCEVLEAGKRQDVYQLGVSLYPVKCSLLQKPHR